MSKWVYNFGGKKTDGSAKDSAILGGKGAHLAEMASLGLPVPPGFTLTTEVCSHYFDHAQAYPKGLVSAVKKSLAKVEKAQERIFGDPDNPLLLSVRSGAPTSMPGMMDTVLNLGLNSQTVKGLIKQSGDELFAWASYRRFIQMFGSVVLGVEAYEFEDIIDTYKRENNYAFDTEMSADDWQFITEEFKCLIVAESGAPMPEDPHEQLWAAIGAVFSSWMNSRAVAYRKIHDIPDDLGTAVNVQAMVFGNMGDDCATGVAFTRDPSSGENYFYGEYLPNAQGEDVVAGIRTPRSLTRYGREQTGSDLPSMEEDMPKVFARLEDVRKTLESHYRAVQDMEFTIERGHLYMLQTRHGKLTSKAALKVAADMVDEGLITKEEAIMRIKPQSLDHLLHPKLDPSARRDVLTRGLPASPGAASGHICFSAEAAEALKREGKDAILCRQETCPEDVSGMYNASGVLTSRGGMTSHAAVVARGMGRPCVVGAGMLYIDSAAKTISRDDRIFKEGDIISIDGSTGEVMAGMVRTIKPELTGDFARLMDWADGIRRMDVRANAETPEDAATARDFGAQGIGLCRTEHMFFDLEHIQSMREMIFADSATERREALDKLLPAQRADFTELFEIMKGMPVTVRLLDPPLHEFLPHSEEDIAHYAAASGIAVKTVERRLEDLQETNPMLGHRGCRLGMTYPEIYTMQAQAIFEAASSVSKQHDEDVILEIMIPLVSTYKELAALRELVEVAAQEVFAKTGKNVPYSIGTMIELPRAALTADEIAAHADFFSFGTNDLTQTTLGMSRDDASRYLPFYVERGIFQKDPFVSLEQSGVGKLVDMATRDGRKTNNNLKTGICGEHGGDPASIEFCERIGLDYVSCSPYRVPIARLAAAQAAIALEHTGANAQTIAFPNKKKGVG